MNIFLTVSWLKRLVFSPLPHFHYCNLFSLSHCLFLVSYLRLLQVLLDVDLVTEVVCLTSSPGLVGPKPLSVEDGALYPLGYRGAQCLTTVISGLLLQVRIHFVCLSLFLPVEQQMILSLLLKYPQKNKIWFCFFLSTWLAFYEHWKMNVLVDSDKLIVTDN